MRKPDSVQLAWKSQWEQGLSTMPKTPYAAMNEGELIRRIAKAVPSQIGRGTNRAPLGIGDDAAILPCDKRFRWVVSCDAFVDGVHFLWDVHPADSVGYKALARAVSDLVAMGAKPRFFLLTLALQAARGGRWLDKFLRGMARAARELDVTLIGGDTTQASIVSISLTVFGQIEPSKEVTRSGARPGDRIYVSGKPGQAQLGLELIRQRYGSGRKIEGTKGRMGAAWGAVLKPHLYPRIRVQLGLWLAQNRIPSAMMDLSDGLSTDLGRLCEASAVEAQLWVERIPTVTNSAALKAAALRLDLDPLKMALHGGDDYELLFAVSRRNESRLRKAPQSRELTCIGEVVRSNPDARRRVLLIDGNGKAEPLRAGGWDSFRGN